jgi:hypothetical protein
MPLNLVHAHEHGHEEDQHQCQVITNDISNYSFCDSCFIIVLSWVLHTGWHCRRQVIVVLPSNRETINTRKTPDAHIRVVSYSQSESSRMMMRVLSAVLVDKDELKNLFLSTHANTTIYFTQTSALACSYVFYTFR